jgi:ribosomal protein S27AE
VIFLVSVLIAIITTTNLLTIETGILLLVLIGPFALSCFLVLMIHPVIEKRSKKGRTLEEPMPFIDSKKFCSKCGEGVFLADKYCTSCGEQLVFPHKMGTYLKNCDKCGGRLYETAEYCPNCGVKIKNEK